MSKISLDHSWVYNIVFPFISALEYRSNVITACKAFASYDVESKCKHRQPHGIESSRENIDDLSVYISPKQIQQYQEGQLIKYAMVNPKTNTCISYAEWTYKTRRVVWEMCDGPNYKRMRHLPSPCTITGISYYTTLWVAMAGQYQILFYSTEKHIIYIGRMPMDGTITILTHDHKNGYLDRPPQHITDHILKLYNELPPLLSQ